MKRYIFVPIIFSVFFAAKAAAQENGRTHIDFGFSGVRTNVSDFDISSRSALVDLENDFAKDKLYIFSGWSFGYRYESSEIAERGHFFNGKAYKYFRGPSGFRPKMAFGIEWGYPTLNYDRSKIFLRDGIVARQEYVALARNSKVPAINSGSDAVWNTFFEAGFEKRLGRFKAETGVRGTFANFIHGENGMGMAGSVISEKNKVIPSVYGRLGIRLR